MMRITYTECPSCSSTNIAYKLTATDFTVSKERFEIWHCNACSIRFTQNIPDQSGIGAYYQSEDYISHTDTKKGVINSLYHIIRKKTLRQKQLLIEKYTGTKSGSLLDIGAGTGAFSGFMKNEGWRVLGLEPDETTRQRAFDLHGITLQSSAELFHLSANSFDAVSMWHVLEHVHELHQYLDKIHEVLKSSGIAFIAVPNYTSYDAELYKEYWAAYDVPRHLYHFSPASMKILIEKHGMTMDSLQPMWFDSFYVSMLSEQYKNGKAGSLTAFKNGLISNGKAFGNKEKCSSLIYVVKKEI